MCFKCCRNFQHFGTLCMKRTILKFIKNESYSYRIIKFIVLTLRIIFEKVTFYKHIDLTKAKNVKILKLSGYRNIFCGYYDVTPFSLSDSNIIVFHATNLSSYRYPNINNKADIIMMNISTDDYEKLDKTSAWNWQQGARLQWIDNENIVYNVIVDGKPKAKMLNIITKEYNILKIPVSIACSRRWIFSIDYYALSKSSEYGYSGISSDKEDTFIQYYDIQHKIYTKLFCWHELLNLANDNSTKHHINHILPNPKCSGFVFIFRYWVKSKRYDSLIYYDIDSMKYDIIIKNQIVSHYTWINNKYLLAWMDISGKYGYYIVNLSDNSAKLLLTLRDGHPNIINNNAFISDINVGSTIKGKLLKLYICDMNNYNFQEIISISHPSIFRSGNRCDMHTSISADKKKYQIDSRHKHNKRTIIIGDIPL